MLDVESATAFLLARGLIDHATFAGDALTVRSAARRNRNLRVEGADGGGFLIKQPDERDAASVATLRTEAAFYRLCGRAPATAAVREVIPRLADHDPENAVLVLELVRGAVPLSSLAAAGEPGSLVAAGRALGRALATLHRAFRSLDRPLDPRRDWLYREVPWALTAHRPEPDLLRTLSPANARLLRIVQDDDGLGRRLEGLGSSWRRDTLIHGDVKFDNVLVVPGAGEVRIVDWEMAQLGDPAYDLAGALQDFLLYWTHSMPVSAALAPATMIEQAGRPLGTLRGAIRAVWHGYRAAAGLDPRAADDLLRRAVALSAARLILSTYEISYEAERLSARSVILLQLAANILADPARAQVELYGIPQGYPLS
jgi:Ser/Thr protein kinase RdoA (MazF antagonist)